MLKAHEGSTAERASLLGDGVVGGVVLNSPVGGANPDAVMVAARLGGRVVWLPTISSLVHKAAHERPELTAHKGIHFRAVPVVDGDGRVLPDWYDVFAEVAAADLILASGHLSLDETVTMFTAARSQGVRRFLVNHPMMDFLGWRDEHADALAQLDARIEVGVLADILTAPGRGTEHLATCYPRELLVFGSDLGHAHYPTVQEGLAEWTQRLAAGAGRGRPHGRDDPERQGAARDMRRIAVLPGDGVGPEVIEGPVALLERLAAIGAVELSGPWPVGASSFGSEGDGLPAKTLAACDEADAILFGAAGEHPGVPLEDYRPEHSLLSLREHYDLRISIRQVLARGIQPITVIRNLLGGAYGSAATRKESDGTQPAADELILTPAQIEELAEIACDLVEQDEQARLLSVDKANLFATSRLWRRVVSAVAARRGVPVRHLYVDRCAYEIAHDEISRRRDPHRGDLRRHPERPGRRPGRLDRAVRLRRRPPGTACPWSLRRVVRAGPRLRTAPRRSPAGEPGWDLPRHRRAARVVPRHRRLRAARAPSARRRVALRAAHVRPGAGRRPGGVDRRVRRRGHRTLRRPPRRRP